MAILLPENGLIIEVFDDTTFKLSGDSPMSYQKVIQAEEDKPYAPAAMHAIKVYENGIVKNTAIILASGGATGVNEGAALLDRGNLIIRCCNKLFSLSLPDLDVNWMATPDWATCFSVHLYEDSYITHGETTIARIDRNGKELWNYGGADIFVCLSQGDPFEMQDDCIKLTDFKGGKYTIGYNGETISYQPSEYKEAKYLIVYENHRKPWWKFWKPRPKTKVQ